MQGATSCYMGLKLRSASTTCQDALPYAPHYTMFNLSSLRCVFIILLLDFFLVAGSHVCVLLFFVRSFRCCGYVHDGWTRFVSLASFLRVFCYNVCLLCRPLADVLFRNAPLWHVRTDFLLIKIAYMLHCQTSFLPL